MYDYIRAMLVARKSERGATAVEYGLMVALIAVIIIAAVQLLGNNLSGIFTTIANAVGAA